jgi:twitching motility protein PilT
MGYHGRSLRTIRAGLERTNGMILTSGPTGSGKSTSLYALLQEVKSDGVNIVTLEDPIEFIHPHKNCIVNQREIGADSETYIDAMKYLLRQDPDVVLLGEMRDLETIEHALAVRPGTR